jgi:hypothetical protein
MASSRLADILRAFLQGSRPDPAPTFLPSPRTPVRRLSDPLSSGRVIARRLEAKVKEAFDMASAEESEAINKIHHAAYWLKCVSWPFESQKCD